MKMNEMAEVSFELNPYLLDEALKQSKPKIFLDLKFALHLHEKLSKKTLFSFMSSEALGICQLPEDLEIHIEQGLIYDMNEYELFLVSNVHKRDANELFKKNLILTAFHRYNKSMRYLIICEQQVKFNKKLAKEEKTQLDIGKYAVLGRQLGLIKSQLFLNIAACQLRSQNYRMAIVNCGKCLLLDKSNVKALFRRAQAYAAINEHEAAIQDLQVAGSLAPDDNDIKKRLVYVQEQQRLYEQALSANLKRMFN